MDAFIKGFIIGIGIFILFKYFSYRERFVHYYLREINGNHTRTIWTSLKLTNGDTVTSRFSKWIVIDSDK